VRLLVIPIHRNGKAEAQFQGNWRLWIALVQPDDKVLFLHVGPPPTLGNAARTLLWGSGVRNL